MAERRSEDDALNDRLCDEARETICAFAGHEYGDAGGGLLICLRCEQEEWADD